MKKYLITLFSDIELNKIREFYNDWDLISMLDINKNLELYNDAWYSSVDLIYIFAKQLEVWWEFWWICSPNIFITKDWIYYYNDSKKTFNRFENWSSIYLLRTQMLDKEYLTFMKLFWKAAFDIDFHYSYNFVNDHIWTKRFWIYWWLLSWTQDHIPVSVIPMASKTLNWKIVLNFLTFYKKIGNKIIIKCDSSSWWKNIYIVDINESKDRNNINWIINIMKDIWKMNIVIMELLDTKDFEIRLLWHKNGWKVNILAMYKKERLEWQILHNISQGNAVKPLSENEYPKQLKKAVKNFCLSLVDNHWWLDILITKNSNFYFTENNVLTWYLDTELETHFLGEWLDSVSKTYN